MLIRPVPVTDPWIAGSDFGLDLEAIGVACPPLAAFRTALPRTPLIEIPVAAGSARVLAKDESRNPFGSIKDRTAFALLAEVVAERRTVADLELVEYSGGNLAEPLSRLCQSLGVPLRMVLSDAVDPRFVRTLRTRGTRVELVDRHAGFLGVMQRARHLVEEHPCRRHLLYQHRSRANPWYHRVSTGAEILEQLDGAVPDRFVASIGSGGTLCGVVEALSGPHPDVRAVAVTPAELPYGSATPPNGSPKYAGSGGLGDGIRQPLVRAVEDRIVEYHTVSRPEALAAMAAHRREHGTWVGSSAAANLLVARDVAARLGPGRTVVTVIPDAGSSAEREEVDDELARQVA